MKYKDHDHTAEEIHKLERFVQHFADLHPDYYRHINKIVSEIKPTSKYEALEFEFNAMVEYDTAVKKE
jgi:hypothetical protein